MFGKLNKKNRIIMIIIIILICVIGIFLLFNRKNIGNNNMNVTNYTNFKKEYADISITYISKKLGFNDVITYNSFDNKFISENKPVTIGFAAVNSLNVYISNQKINNEEFFKENGYVYAYYKYKSKEIYLLGDLIKKQWNLLIYANKQYKMIKLCDMSDGDFIKKVENIKNEIYFT